MFTGSRLAIFTTLMVVGCNSSNFSSTNKRKTQNQPVIAATPSPSLTLVYPTPTPMPTQDCGPQGITNATLKTPEVYSNKANQFIRFEMYLTDCFGKIQPLTADSILFDLDVTTSQTTAMNFTLTDDKNAALGSGTLQVVNGSDMFGNKGDFQHYKTSGSLKFNSTTSKIIFSVDLSNRSFKPRVGPSEGQVEVYLRFAQATVNQQKVMVHGTP